MAFAPPAADSTYVPPFVFSGHKTGMPETNTDAAQRIHQIVEKASKGSAYYDQAAKQAGLVAKRAAETKERVAQLTTRDLSVAELIVDARVKELEETRDLTRVWCVVDFDQFFAAVEIRDDPSLRGKPLAVGRTLISTASYEARTFGVRSAMPTFIARQLCPELVVVGGRGQAYAEVARVARGVFKEFDPEFCAASFDEACLDLTNALGGSLNLMTPEGVEAAQELVEKLRRRLTEVTNGLTCSAGIGPTPALAKIAAEVRKPNGQFAVSASSRAAVVDYVHSLKTRQIPGIGKATEHLLLNGYGIECMGDVWDKRYVLERTLTPALYEFLLRSSMGIDERGFGWFAKTADEASTTSTTVNTKSSLKRYFGGIEDEEPIAAEADDDNPLRHEEEGVDSEVSEDRGRKSISLERTFRRNLMDPASLRNATLDVCEKLAREIRPKALWGRTVTLKLKTTNFVVQAKSESIAQLIGGSSISGYDIYHVLESILRVYISQWTDKTIGYRLIGVKLSGLEDPPATGKQAPVLRQVGIAPYLPKESSTCCPVCSKAFPFNQNNEHINAHIDSCLNLSVVKELTGGAASSEAIDVEAESASRAGKPRAGGRRLDDFFSSAKRNKLA